MVGWKYTEICRGCVRAQQSVAVTSPLRPNLDSGPVFVGFVVGKVTMVHIEPRVRRYFLFQRYPTKIHARLRCINLGICSVTK
jgi:hypothetical protein